MRAIDSVTPYEQNPREIGPEAIERVAASLREFGWRQPIVVDGNGVIVVGHTRWLAAKSLGWTDVPVHVATDLSAEQARAYRLADNRVAEYTGWDMGMLRLEVADLKSMGVELDQFGFADMADLMPPDPDEEPGAPEDPGSVLDLMKVTIGDPAIVVEHGDHYVLGGRHHLFVASVMADWQMWSPYLVDGALFCPWPGPFAPYGKKADKHALVLVTPDPYTAGHILDRYVEVYGKKAIKRETNRRQVEPA